MMTRTALLLLTTVISSTTALSFTSKTPKVATPLTRRVYISNLLKTTAAAALVLSPQQSLAEEPDDLVEVYFGCGCFWHVQHEFVEAERKLLNRSEGGLTSRAGYAGGKAGMKDGKVCYHNAKSVSDYGTLGHAEVVKVDIPRSKFAGFVEEYVKLFDKEGNRPDQAGDRGTEYRNLVGIPGGVKGDLAKELVEISKVNGDKLDFAVGKGDDADTRSVVYVMDTKDYPFYVGEQYHQFHDGFAMGENYPKEYNGLAAVLAKKEVLGTSDCPNGLLGLGVGGL